VDGGDVSYSYRHEWTRVKWSWLRHASRNPYTDRNRICKILKLTYDQKTMKMF